MPIDVSIIIPLYNKEHFIIDTLKGIRAQDFENWECIIIDDGSTDGSLKVVTDFCNAHSGNWKIYSVPNGGQTKARNVGISHATGRYLAFLDADDLWVTNKLSKQFEYLEANNEIIGVLSGYAIFNSKSKHFRVVIDNNFDKMLENWASMRGFGGGIESGGLVMKSALREVGGFNEQLSTSAGLDLTIRLSLIGKILFANNTCFRYRKYVGQWHTFESVLVENLSLLRSSRFTQGNNLQRKHQAYILFSRFRTSPRKAISGTGLSAIFRLSPVLFHLLASILLRNLLAVMNGFLMAKSLNKLFN